jgi:AraC-like DNA-binding protein
MSEPTTLATWAAAIAAALHARGVDATALLQQAGLDPALLHKPGARYPVRAMTRYWELAVLATDDALPLSVPRHVQPATMHALGLSLRASRSLNDALLRMARYSRLVTDAADISIELDGAQLSVIYNPPRRDLKLADAAYLAFMATAVELGRMLAGTQHGLIACELRQPAPQDPLPFQHFFDCPLRFSAPRNRLIYTHAQLLRPLAGANDRAAHFYDTAAAEYLARFDANPVSQRLRELLIRALPSGEPSRANLAAALHLTPRTLLRRLQAEGTNWKELLNDVRRELALSYLRQGRSAAEVTWLLGFSDPGNFTRAFKRWTGTRPSDWRREAKMSPLADSR